MKKLRLTKRPRHRLVIVDDHALVRRGLASLIKNEPDLDVCAEAATRQAGLEAIASTHPDMVTVDISLRDSDGLELTKDIHARFPSLPVLVVSMHDEAVYAERAFRAGASGYVTKEQMNETVLAAIRCVLTGGQYLSPKMCDWFARQYLARHRDGKDSRMARLSDREIEVLRLIGGGKSTREIAEGLKLSIKTIESYREHLKSKLTLQSGAELVRFAARWVETGQTS